MTHRSRILWVAMVWALVALWLPSGAHVARATTPDTTGPPPPSHLHLPAITYNGGPPPPALSCPATSSNLYISIPIEGSPHTSVYTPAQNPDLNLAVRGYATVPAGRELINLGGDTDADAPQLAFLFRPPRVPVFESTQRVYDWDWACPIAQPGFGCRGGLLSKWDVTLLSMEITAGEAIYPPARHADILNGVYIAMVLYAEERRLTIIYTREDTVAKPSYVVHLEDVCVDPALLGLYQRSDAAGRTMLPALRRGDVVGTALGEVIRVAVRDTGEFMDPRSAKDWWQDVARAAQNPDQPAVVWTEFE